MKLQTFKNTKERYVRMTKEANKIEEQLTEKFNEANEDYAIEVKVYSVSDFRVTIDGTIYIDPDSPYNHYIEVSVDKYRGKKVFVFEDDIETIVIGMINQLKIEMINKMSNTIERFNKLSNGLDKETFMDMDVSEPTHLTLVIKKKKGEK